MASSQWSNRLQYDPLSFLTRRAISPRNRQCDLFLRRRVAHGEAMYCKDFTGHYGCVNAIEFSHGVGEFIASGGDDRRVLLWNVEKALSDIGKPAVMKGEHNSNIFCIAFDINNTTAFSGGNDEQVVVHDLTTGETKDVFAHEDAVYGISPDPTNPSVFASSCDDGRVLIYDTRDSTAEPFCLANYTSSMHSVMYNPVEPRLLVTANAKEGVGLWDVRKPRSCMLRYGGSLVQQSCMSVRFNQRGDQLIALRRRLPPVLYKIDSNLPVCEFDHSGYYNSCTMKSICYAGDNDQYVVSGSDEFNLYMWAVPEDLSERLYINSAHMVLKGHRSIVNQVRFNIANHLIISSGVEKIIKVWSPFKHSAKTVTRPRRNVRERPVYSHEEYINLVLQDGHVMSHDYSQESMDEDPRMMAFFDSLVQRELEGWSSDDSLSSNEEALYSRIIQLTQSDIDSDDSLMGTGTGGSDDDPSFSPFTIAFASVMASQAAEGNERYPRLNNAQEITGSVNAEVTENNESQGAETEASANIAEESSQRETNSRRDITELVKKKKMELKEIIRKRIADCKATVSSSSSSNSDSNDSDNSGSSLNSVKRKDRKEKSKEKSISKEASKVVLKKENDSKKQAQLKLKRFRNLRNSILNSESENSDLDKEKTEGNIVTSCLAKGEDTCEKVEFKKFKRRNSETKTKASKERLKSRASPDLGPYLQQTVAASSIEVRRSSVEDRVIKRGKHFPNDTESLKGKHKSKSEHVHRTDREIDSVHRSSKGQHSSNGNSSRDNGFKRRTKSADCKDVDSNEDKHKYKNHSESNVEHSHNEHKHHVGDKIKHKTHSDSGRRSEGTFHSDEFSDKSCKSCRKLVEPQKHLKDKVFSQTLMGDSSSKSAICKHCQSLLETKSAPDETKSSSKTLLSLYTDASDLIARTDNSPKKSNDRTNNCDSKQEGRHSEHSDVATPSCSYSSSSDKTTRKARGQFEESEDSDSEKNPDSEDRHGRTKSEYPGDNKAHHSSGIKRRKSSSSESADSGDDKVHHSSGVKRRKSSSSDDEKDDSQPTWTEFKRFKNKLKRARKHYDKHKQQKKSGRRFYSEDEH